MAMKEQVVTLPHVTEDKFDTITKDELTLPYLSIRYETNSHIRIRIHLQIVVPRNGRVVNGLGRAWVGFG